MGSPAQPYTPDFEFIYFGVPHAVPKDQLCKRSDAETLVIALNAAHPSESFNVQDFVPIGATVQVKDPSLGWLGINRAGIPRPYVAAWLLAEETPYGAWGTDASGADAWIAAAPPVVAQPPASNPTNSFPGFPGSVAVDVHPTTILDRLNRWLDSIGFAK